MNALVKQVYLKIPKGLSEVVNQRRAENTIGEKNKDKQHSTKYHREKQRYDDKTKHPLMYQRIYFMRTIIRSLQAIVSSNGLEVFEEKRYVV